MKKPTNADQLAMQAVPHVNGEPLLVLLPSEREAQIRRSAMLQNLAVYSLGYSFGFDNGRDHGAWADLY